MLKSFFEWLENLGVYDAEDLAILIAKGFFGLLIVAVVLLIVGLFCTGAGISGWWSPVVVLIILAISFLIGAVMNMLGIWD